MCMIDREVKDALVGGTQNYNDTTLFKSSRASTHVRRSRYIYKKAKSVQPFCVQVWEKCKVSVQGQGDVDLTFTENGLVQKFCLAAVVWDFNLKCSLIPARVLVNRDLDVAVNDKRRGLRSGERRIARTGRNLDLFVLKAVKPIEGKKQHG